MSQFGLPDPNDDVLEERLNGAACRIGNAGVVVAYWKAPQRIQLL